MTKNPTAVTETRLIHEVHRQATVLLAQAAVRPGVPLSTLAELRDFVVATLHHHHQSEDHILWPSITAVAPWAGVKLVEISAEHDLLDAALDALAMTPLRDDSDRPALSGTAAAVRDLVHWHLEHEEPILLPALQAHMPDEAWADFSRTTIASAPTVGAHLMIGFLDQCGTPAEVDMVTANLPEPARQMLPAMRQAAAATFTALAVQMLPAMRQAAAATFTSQRE